MTLFEERFFLYFIALFVVFTSAIVHGGALFGVTPRTLLSYSDIAAFYEKATHLEQNIEYPILTQLFVRGAGVLAHSSRTYFLLNALGLAFIFLLATHFLLKIDPSTITSIKKYWFFAPSMFVFLVYNWDMLAIFFMLLAFYFFYERRFTVSSLALALAVAAKFYPILYFIPFFLWAPHRRAKISILLGFLATTLLANAFFAYQNFDQWVFFFKKNAERPPNVDSMWNLIAGGLHATILEINIVSFLVLVLGYSFILWKMRRAALIEVCFALTLLFLIGNKVLSPQYLLWLLPLFTLLHWPHRKSFYALEFFNIMVFIAVIPYIFDPRAKYFLHYIVLFAILRAIVLCYMLYLVMSRPSNTAFSSP